MPSKHKALSTAYRGWTFLFMIPKLKPALEIEEQIKNLKIKHKLIINDTNRAKEILESVNYYRLTGYGLGLKRKGNEDEYIDGISLEHIYKLYQFDTIK